MQVVSNTCKVNWGQCAVGITCKDNLCGSVTNYNGFFSECHRMHKTEGLMGICGMAIWWCWAATGPGNYGRFSRECVAMALQGLCTFRFQPGKLMHKCSC